MRPKALALLSEPALVSLAAAGDRSAFAELMLRRESNLRRMLRRLCGDGALADDLAQQAFLQAWRSLASLRSAGAFGGWLRRLAVNAWLQHLRRKGFDLEALDDDRSDDGGSAIATDMRLDLDRALARLRPVERLCIVLNYVEGLSHGEIAGHTDLPIGTVKSHVTRGSARLRALLNPEAISK